MAGSLGIRDSESCWFTEEIGTYMRCWERPGDLPLVIEILFLFARFATLHSRKDIQFLSLVKDLRFNSWFVRIPIYCIFVKF